MQARIQMVAEGLSKVARARVVLGLVGLLVAVHGLAVWAGFPDDGGWHLALGLSRETVAAGPWRCFTYAWLHGGWPHLALNAVFLLLIGAGVERVCGRMGLLRITLAGVLGGAVGHLLLGGTGEGLPLLVGFSGACMALLLHTTTVSPDSTMWPVPLSGRSVGCGILLAEGLLALLNPQLGLPVLAAAGGWLERMGLGSWFTVGHACHLGGGVAGWLMARWQLRNRVTLERLRLERARREAREVRRG